MARNSTPEKPALEANPRGIAAGAANAEDFDGKLLLDAPAGRVVSGEVLMVIF